MQIFITLPTGKTQTIDIQLNQTVLTLKQKIMEKHSFPIEQQIILFNEITLHNDKTLESYGIKSETKLVLETYKSRDDKNAKELKKLSLNLELKTNELDQFKKKLEEAHQEKQRIQQDLIDEQSNAQKNESMFQSQITDLQQQLNMKESELKSLKNLQQENMNQTMQVQNNQQKSIETIEFQKKLIKMESELTYQTRINKDLQGDKEMLQSKLESALKYKEELMEKKYEIRSKISEIEFLQQQLELNKSDTSERESILSQELQKSKIINEELNQQIKKLSDQNKQLEIEKIKNQFSETSNSDQINNLEKSYRQREEECRNLQSELQKKEIVIRELEDQLKNNQKLTVSLRSNPNEKLQQEEIYNLQDKIQKLTIELKSKESSFEESQIQLSKTKKDAYEGAKKIKELETSMEFLKTLTKEKDRKIKELETAIQILNMDLESSKKDEQFYKDQIKQLSSNQATGKVVNMDIETKMAQHEELKRQREEFKLREKVDREKEEELMKERTQVLDLERQRQQKLLTQEKGARVKMASFLKKQMMETHGKIECCFLIDVTQSMDSYKEQAMLCINESMKSIKIKTNRDALWSAIAYQDFGELKQLGGLYRQIGFTPSPDEIKRFLEKIKCEGGADYAEDVRGAIKQMIQNLNWSKTFKIAILICDAPTHGKRYNGGVSDRYQNEDIEDAIQMLIQNNVLFVGILFNKNTVVMFEEIQKIYREADKEELLLVANLEKVSEGYIQILHYQFPRQIWQELVDLVSQASQRVTQTNNKGTKSKNPVQNKKSQDGAMEALCKTLKDPFEFDKQPGVKVINTQFQVYRVEIKQEAFESQIENIERIQLPRDYLTHKEGTWQCIRTQNPFAFGQMKAVFLMKRQNYDQVELYVIKMPLGDKTYPNLEAAMQDCRSHLIAKCLMRKFIKDLRAARDQKNQRLKFNEPQYSDFLILQESPDSFWIAERFFKGDFVKYNNNYGYISDEDNELNHMAQAFSYYTFFISNFNYMVSDVQGVGLYFTDPALNTKQGRINENDILQSGNYDETDMGKDGQSMFMVAYAGKKMMGKVFLDLLGIELE